MSKALRHAHHWPRAGAVALGWLLAAAPAVAQEAPSRTGEIRPAPQVGTEAAQAGAPSPESVGALAAPTATTLDEGAVRSGKKTLTWLGFHHAKSYSRLFIKTSERVALDVTPGLGSIRVKLKQTRVRLSNDLRVLDVSFFPSALWRVAARRAGDDTDVEITMRAAVSYKVRRAAETIHIDFDLPAKK